MPHRLLIRLNPGGATEWLAQARDGAVVQGPLAGLPAQRADEVVLLLPAEDVLLLPAPRIARSRAQLAQALPYAIEEQLAAPVETQHVAFDDRGGGELALAVIDRARLDAALQRLRDAGLEADAAYAESQLLPLHDDAITALVDGERAILRWARSGAMATATDALGDALALLSDTGVQRSRLRLIGAPEQAVPDTLRVEQEALGTALRWFAQRLPQADGPNLLQGDYRPPRRRAEAGGLWRWAALFAGAALALGLVHAAVERAQLQRQVAAQQAEMEQLLRYALPGVQRVVDPVAQLRVELERGGGQHTQGALPLLAQVAPALSGTGRYTLEAIEFRAGTLDIVIVAPDVAALDQLREGLASLPPLQVELTAATPGSRGVEGRLRIRGGPA